MTYPCQRSLFRLITLPGGFRKATGARISANQARYRSPSPLGQERTSREQTASALRRHRWRRDKLGPSAPLCVRAVRSAQMFNPTLIIIEAFIRELRTMYERTYGTLEPGYPGVMSFVAQLALENIATSDAPYHDVNHTIMVTLVGQEILRGRHISIGGVTPRDWLHCSAMISVTCAEPAEAMRM